MDSETLYPFLYEKVVRSTVFLKHFVTNPLIEIGDYTYYDDFSNHPEAFQHNNVHYFWRSKLIIGKFCQIAMGTRFIGNEANHPMDGFSTYPFFTFAYKIDEYIDSGTKKGDTIIGNDVWLGTNSVIMPGVTIGNGAIIGAYSIVTKDVEPYTIVGGNPAKIIRKRFDIETVKILEKIKWWDWPIEKILKYQNAILGKDLKALEKAHNTTAHS